MKTILALAVLLCVAGCSPQKDLAHRLKGADRLNAAGVRDPEGTVGMTITGTNLSNVVQAIANAQEEPRSIAASPELRLEFYKGTQHLATITKSGIAFWIRDIPYSDRSGTFEKLFSGFYGVLPP